MARTTFSLPVTALSWVAESAVTVIAPSMSSSESVTRARAAAGVSPLNASEINGSPRNASMALKKTFEASHPIELKVRMALVASFEPSMMVDAKASSCPVWEAPTTRVPAVTGLRVTSASAEPSTTFVTSTTLPPSRAEMTLESLELSSASFPAITRTAPPTADTVVSSTLAVVEVRTSLYATVPR